MNKSSADIEIFVNFYIVDPIFISKLNIKIGTNATELETHSQNSFGNFRKRGGTPIFVGNLKIDMSNVMKKYDFKIEYFTQQNNKQTLCTLVFNTIDVKLSENQHTPGNLDIDKIVKYNNDVENVRATSGVGMIVDITDRD